MRCPTCSSPLPDGAMFCGQCGRAITSADWAAFRARTPVETTPDEATPLRPWVLQEPPAAAVPAGTPWWLETEAPSEDAGTASPLAAAGATPPGADGPDDAGDDRPGAEPDASVGVGGHDTTASGQAASGAQRGPTEPRRDEPGSDEPGSDLPGSDLPGSRLPVSDEPGSDLPGSRLPVSDEPDSAAPGSRREGQTPPSALRPPQLHPTHDRRPTSAPLWTASLTPIAGVAAADEGPSADAPNPPGEGSVAEVDDDRALARRVPVVDAAPSDPEPASEAVQSGISEAAAQSAQDGDTNVIVPLVAPTAARESGAPLCSNCGAALHEGDIFCGECGAVVQSVADSFTGPITPLPGGSVRPSSAPVSQVGSDPDHAVTEPAAPPAPRAAPLSPTPLPSAADAIPPFVPDPEPAPKRRRLFGRRQPAESPRLWSSSSSSSASRPESEARSAPVEPVRHAGTPTHSAPTTGAASSSPLPPIVAAQPPAAGATAHSPAAEPPVGVEAVPVAEPAPPASPVQPPVRAAERDSSQPAPEPMPVIPGAPAVEPSAAPWAVTLGAPADDVESTRIVPRKPVGEPFILQFSTGESFTVQGSGLVGRAPTPQPGEAIELLVRIFDPGRSVSKTHLEFGQDDGHLWVADRWSGNGTVVKAPSQEVRRAEPGKRVRVPRGARVEIGEQFFIVS